MTDSNWLKIALQLNGRGGATELAAEQPLAETTAYWVHLDYTREESEQWLRRQSIPQAVIDSLTAAETRPRASEVAGGVLVYLRGVNLNPLRPAATFARCRTNDAPAEPVFRRYTECCAADPCK